MAVLRLRHNASLQTGPLFAADCGVKLKPADDRVIRSNQNVLRSLGGGLLGRYTALGYIKPYVLYYRAWMPVDNDEVRITQTQGHWSIQIKTYDILEG